jgi:hypothetical protein
MVILLVLLVEENILGYIYSGSLVEEKSLGIWFYFWFCWLKRKVWDGYYGYAGWRNTFLYMVFWFCLLKRKVCRFGYSFGFAG